MATGDLVTGDYEFEYRGFGFGGDGSNFLVAPGFEGFYNLPGVAVADRQRLRRHGLYPGDDFMLGRDLVIPIEVVADTEAQWETDLDTLKQAFRVDSDSGEEPLVFQVPGVAGGGVRRINCRPRGLQVAHDLEWYYNIPTVEVRLTATSPYLLDNTEQTVASSILVAGSDGLAWPLQWPLNWGTVTAASFNVTNSGTQAADWCARIPGPVSNPKIGHVGQSRTLELDMTIASGDYVLVDSDARTVLLNGTASRYSSLSQSSQWFTLEPETNELTYRADSGSSNMTISFRSTWA